MDFDKEDNVERDAHWWKYGRVSRNTGFVLVLLLIVGCQSPKMPVPVSKNEPVPTTNAQPSKMQLAFGNERLKRHELGNNTVTGDSEYRHAWGMWVPESNDPADVLIFPEQVRIICTKQEWTCHEMVLPLGVTSEMVMLMDIEEKDWPIRSWDTHGLLASYGPDTSAIAPLSDRCHFHTLVINFSSGTVSTSDIPTHEKGCEAFLKTDSYRLVMGNYYVDTSPANDADKPRSGK